MSRLIFYTVIRKGNIFGLALFNC